jgi:hypothetical protein
MSMSEETTSMKTRFPTLAALLGASILLVVLFALPAPAGAAEGSPWWQLLSGSRPTNLQAAPDRSEVQKVVTTKTREGGEEYLAAKVEVGGELLGCLGAGELLSLSASQLCLIGTGLPATETAAGLQAMLEESPPYSEGEGVRVTGTAKVGEGPASPIFVTTTGRWVAAPVVVTPLSFEGARLGSASSQVISEGSGILTITLTNLGNATAEASGEPLAIHDSLPPGAQAYGVRAIAGATTGEAEPVRCALPGAEELACGFEGELPAYEAIEVEVLVALKEGAGAEAGEVSVSGAGAPAVSRPQALNLSAAPVPFGLEYFSMRAETQGGEPLSADGASEADAAGSHPFQLTTTIVANTGPQSGAGRRPNEDARVAQPALPRNLRFTLPAGFVGNVAMRPTCDMATFLNNENGVNRCRAGAAIGASSVTVVEPLNLGLTRIAVPVFNLPAGRGEPARFGLTVAGDPVVIDTSVDPEDEYRISAEVRNISQAVQFLASTTTLWGNPGAPAHDATRGWKCVYRLAGVEELPGTCPDEPAERHEVPLLRLPVSCRSPLRYEAAFEPWNVPLGSLVAPASSQSPPPVACNREPFDPSLALTPTSEAAAAPSGLDAEVSMPNQGLLSPGAETSEAQFKRAEVTLPEGVTVNPSAAEGLAVCSQAGYEAERYDSRPGEGCPQASKLGSVKIRTPLLAEEVEGALYQAEPYENPTHSLLGLYLVARVPERGVLVKQAGEVDPDPRTGRLRTVFDGVPQIPIDYFRLHFREGGRAPLITPPGCGTFHTVARFVPWSASDPDGPAPGEVLEQTAPFTIQRGVGGGACPSGPAPFRPRFEASALNDQAGAYSPFQLRITRSDGEQDMGKLSFVLPPGVVPRLAGIPYCSEADIARAASRQGPHGGSEEKDSPSCPAASRIGSTVAGAGVGNQLTFVPGALYLAGPWHGDPLSAVAITPAIAGPFDAGVVVVREALRLNPVTHVGEVDGQASDPIPHILKGIPLSLRDLRVYADRPQFTLNPTSCEPFETRSTIWGEGTALEPRPPSPVELSSRFQAAGCAGLGFKPSLRLRLRGGTRRGAFPALRAAYIPRKDGDANLRRLALAFPSSEFVEQGHFRTICTRVQFRAGAGFGERCPKGSVYGHVEVWTPLLDEPLQGPVYLRSSNHNLPDAVLALHGLVDVEVSVRIDSVHGRLRATVQNAPDAPVSRALVRMQGARKGLFVNSRNLCSKSKRNRARANAKGQNGRRSLTRPPMHAQRCGKAKRKAHRSHRRRGRRS